MLLNRITPETLITNDFIAPTSKVEIVTGSNRVTCLEVHDTRMVGEVGLTGVSWKCSASIRFPISVR